MSSSTIRTLILSSIILLIAIAVFGLALYTIHGERTQLAEQVSTLAEQQGQENSFYRLQRVAMESKDDRDRLRNYFLLQQSDSIDFLNQVEALAPQIGVTLETDSLTQLPETKTGDNWIEVGFSYNGSRESVQRFTTLLEHLPYVSYVTQYSVAADTPTNWKAEIKILVYVLSYDS